MFEDRPTQEIKILVAEVPRDLGCFEIIGLRRFRRNKYVESDWKRTRKTRPFPKLVVCVCVGCVCGVLSVPYKVRWVISVSTKGHKSFTINVSIESTSVSRVQTEV